MSILLQRIEELFLTKTLVRRNNVVDFVTWKECGIDRFGDTLLLTSKSNMIKNSRW